MEDQEWTSIQIAGPLPMLVAGTLMSTIGTLWPEAMIETDSHYALNMKIPSGRSPENLDEEFLEAMREGAKSEGHYPVDFLGFKDGWVAFAPAEELCLKLGEIAHAIFLAHDGAINHVEWTVTTGKKPDDPSYVLSVSKSKGQTPLAMRLKAEAEVERLQGILKQHSIDY